MQTGKTLPNVTWIFRNLLLVAVSLVLLFVLARWAIYRLDHTVSSDAVVQGNVAIVGTRLDGRIAQVNVQANQLLKAGDVIAWLEDDHLQARLGEAQTIRAQAAKELAFEQTSIEQLRRELKLAVSVATANVANGKKSLAAARAVEETTHTGYERVAKLPERVLGDAQKDVWLLKWRHATRDVAVVEADYEGVKLALEEARVRLAGLASRKQRLAVLEQNVELADARIALVEAELAATIIRSPVDGWVGTRIAGAGTSVRVGDPIISILENGPLWLEAWVPESALDELSVGQSVEVRLRAYPNDMIAGEVQAIGVLSSHERSMYMNRNVSAIGTTNKVGVRIAFPTDHDLRLIPGLTATIGMETPDGVQRPFWEKLVSH